jgi:peptidoglycan/LPS O-acetylase OafA/YrhL
MNIKSIHIIRGIASLLVVVYHAKFVLWSGGREYIEKIGLNSAGDYLLFGIDMLSSCGKQAVISFFLLSAFVITHSFRKHRSLTLFAKTRAVRIYLPYLFSVLLSGIVLFLCGTYLLDDSCSTREYNTRLFSAYSELSFATFIKTLIFLPNNEYFGFNFAYWSLLHEAIFYLLFPLYFKMTDKLLVVATAAAVSISVISGSNIFYYQSFFLIGILMYNMIYWRHKRLNIGNGWLMCLIVALFILTNVLAKADLSYAADFTSLLIFLFAINLLLTVEINPGSLWAKLADKSFSLYLFHLPILMLYFSILSKYFSSCIFYNRLPYYTGVLLAILINIPLYYLAEHQSLKIIRRIKQKENDINNLEKN